MDTHYRHNINEIFHDFIIEELQNKWEIIKSLFEYLPNAKKQVLIDDFENTLLHVNPRRFPKYRYHDKGLLLKSIKLCFQNRIFKENLLHKHLDITEYFYEFDSCLSHGGDVPMTNYDFLQPLK